MNHDLGRAAIATCAMATIFCAWAHAADAKAGEGKPPNSMPLAVIDNAGADWVIEPFAGNISAGQRNFFDGPATEVGGLGTPNKVVFSPDGTAYFKSYGVGVITITPDGIARLLLNENGAIEGPASEACAGDVAYNAVDKSLYLTGPDCIRRLYTRPDGKKWVEIVAGAPGSPGNIDGPGKSARVTSKNFTRFGFGEQGEAKDFFMTSTGTLYFSDAGIRKLEKGIVSTVTKAIPGFMTYNEADDLFYLKSTDPIVGGLGGDVFNPKTGKVSRFVGMAKPKWVDGGKFPPNSLEFRYGRNSDGPALTHASFNSNFMDCVWDPIHKALWVHGPDEESNRWVKDGILKTVIPKEKGKMMWTHVIGVDYAGSVYITDGRTPVGIWKASSQKAKK